MFTKWLIFRTIKIGDKMQRYFCNSINNNIMILSKEDSYHIIKVMRMNLSDKIEVVNNKQVYICKIIELNPFVKVEIIKIQDENNELETEVTLVQSLVKEQKMDYILQKATELGVYKIIPYQASRSIVNVSKKEDKKQMRWQTILKEASEQSKRNIIPEITQSMSLSEIVNLHDYDTKILCTIKENTESLKKVLSKSNSSGKMLIVVGPEGGFTEEETNTMISNGFITVSLGSSVLRTETASLFILSSIRYHSMR